jgi:hypothetical protein
MKPFLYIWISLSLGSCKNAFQKEEVSGEQIIARAGNESLSEQEFIEGFITGSKGKDSLEDSRRSIAAWATESLFYQEAIEKLNEEEIDINKEVENYKKSLVNYIYQTKLIEANLDTLVSIQEIENYYNTHRDNFILKENIIKVNYFKVPLKAPALAKIKKLLWSEKSKDKVQLNELISQNAENFYMNDSAWLFLEDIKKEIPALRDQPDFNLTKGRLVEFSDEPYYYYLKVKDVKVKNTLSPVSFEYINIKKFIINNRKTQLIKSYKQGLLEKAISEKKFSIR